jgi:hypothetical protein
MVEGYTVVHDGRFGAWMIACADLVQSQYQKAKMFICRTTIKTMYMDFTSSRFRIRDPMDQ